LTPKDFRVYITPGTNDYIQWIIMISYSKFLFVLDLDLLRPTSR